MRVGLLMSTRGSSPLIHGIREHIAGLEDYQPGDSYDLVLIVNQTAHTKAYEYPEFPRDSTPIAFIDTAEYGTWGQPYNAFDVAARTHDEKNHLQQGRLEAFLRGRSFPYFLREMWKWAEYPAAYHPIDYPLPRESKCRRVPDRDEYLRRTVPLACIWGMSNAGRFPLTDEARKIPGADVYALEVDGPRLPQETYFQRLEAARCTMSFDGYGSSSFRLPEALVRTVLLLGPLRIRQRAPLVDGVTCFAYENNLTERVGDVLRDPEAAFEVYRAGYDHCMTHYTEAATARYIMETIERHDWSRPTIP